MGVTQELVDAFFMKNGMFIYVLLPLTNTVSQFERRISIPQLQVRGALSGG